MLKKLGLIVFAFVFVLTGMTYAQDIPASNTKIPLYSKKAPRKKRTDEKDWPSLTLYLLEQGSGSAVVICPGGGYGHLAMDHEGHQVARWLNSIGVSAVILEYRHAPLYKHPVPMDDAMRAMRTVRANAEKWRINPNQIGIMGFSAGGHLASTVGTHFDEGNPSSKDEIEKISSRPDFMILVYPVITFYSDYHHGGSMRNLLGDNPSPDLIQYYSNHMQIVPFTPPTFLVHGSDDKVVPVENSLLFYKELRRQGIPAEMHLYEHGKHGFGLAPNDPVLHSWTRRCEDWLKVRGLIK